MLLEGRLTLNALIQTVWDFLLNPQTLLSCIPGAEKIECIDEKTYDCVVKQKVGPISVRFKFEFVGEGEDIGKAGHLVRKTAVDLRENPQGEAEIAYTSDVSIAGRLAIFGDKVMRAKAKTLEKYLVKRLQERLESLTS